MNKILMTVGALSALTLQSRAQQVSAPDSVPSRMQHTQQLSEVVISTGKHASRRMTGALNGSVIGRDDLFKAACCNLGESFVTNPSVDVNYDDATTGARQIKLLGLSGTYVQMLTENLPAFRGAALPYALGYVPGTWMKSIQVSKGNSSVKNGYEGMTGQINVEYLKPEDPEGAAGNLYVNTMGKLEANADANVHLGKGLSTEVMAHFENKWGHHDGNGDSFQDDPNVRQYNFQNRWLWQQGRYIFHGGLSLLSEDRHSGQSHHVQGTDHAHPYTIDIATHRYEGYMKHAYITDPEHESNVALIGNMSMHQQDARYGLRRYDVNEKNAYTQLMYETRLAPEHQLSVGASLNYDYLGQRYRLQHAEQEALVRQNERETTSGLYAQYTYSLGSRLVAMAGVRVDHSSVYGTFVTPRLHLKWVTGNIATIRLSAGKGYRSPHLLAENSYLLASGRTLVIDQPEQEAAWNYGASTALYLPLLGRTLKMNLEYYYTHFIRQTLVDYDADPTQLRITNLRGRSFSHTFQVDASYPVAKGLELTAAYRYNLVKATYGGRLQWKPLQSRYKALLTASYKTPLGLWQVDATLALNGGGRMPTPYTLADGSPSWQPGFKAYESLSAQVTRHFRRFSVYVGGENLTGFRQKNPIIGASTPWSERFEPTMTYGPVSGAMAYAGIRFNMGKRL